MAQTINAISLNNVFNSTAVTLTAVTGSATTAEIVSDISGAQDDLCVLVDLTAASSGTYTLECLNGDYNAKGHKLTAELTVGKLNVIPVSSLEIKKYDGKAAFNLKTDVETGFSVVAVSFAVLKHAYPVNH